MRKGIDALTYCDRSVGRGQLIARERVRRRLACLFILLLCMGGCERTTTTRMPPQKHDNPLDGVSGERAQKGIAALGIWIPSDADNVYFVELSMMTLLIRIRCDIQPSQIESLINKNKNLFPSLNEAGTEDEARGVLGLDDGMNRWWTLAPSAPPRYLFRRIRESDPDKDYELSVGVGIQDVHEGKVRIYCAIIVETFGRYDWKNWPQERSNIGRWPPQRH